MTNYYAELIKKREKLLPIILDSGVSTELERKGAKMRNGQWSGCVAIDDYEKLVETHIAYINAGADIITVNSYASSRLMLGPAGLGDEVQRINQLNISAAVEAREKTGAKVSVAGSISHVLPFTDGVDGAKQQPDISSEELTNCYREMITIFEKEGVDLILLEMMSIPVRMTPLFDCANPSSLPIWCGLSAKRETPSAQLTSWHDTTVSFRDIVIQACQYDFDAIGIMHTSVDAIEAALGEIKNHFSGMLMAYPDSGYFVAPNWQFEDIIKPQVLLEYAKGWRKNGCLIFGGCCGLGPEHTAALTELQ
jgi:homocysteine S-methyltransferase